MSESEQDFQTPRVSIVGEALKNAELARSVIPDERKFAALTSARDVTRAAGLTGLRDSAKLAGLANVREMTRAVGLSSLHDSTRLAGLARLSLDATKVAALENIREAIAPGVAGLAESAKLAGLTSLRDATKVAGLADLQTRFDKAGLTAASVKEQTLRLDRIANQAAMVERFERDQRMVEAMKARNRIDDELRELSLRQARRAAELEAAQLGTLDQLVALNERIDGLNERVDGLAETTAVVADEERARAERDRRSTRWLVLLAAATALLTAIVVGLTVALILMA